MTAGQNSDPLSKQILAEDFYENLHRAYRNMRKIFSMRSRSGVTQDDIAAKLRIDKALVSKRLSGKENMTMKTLSHMASALSCRLMVDFEPYEYAAGNNHDCFPHEAVKPPKNAMQNPNPGQTVPL